MRISTLGPARNSSLYVFAVLLLLVFWVNPAFSQQFSVNGTVLDQETGAPIVGVHVFISNTMLGTTTNEAGVYVITGIPIGTHTLAASVLGYEPYAKELRVTERADQSQVILLSVKVYETEGVEVTAERVSKREERRRASDFDTFRKYFLGISPYASQCTILNPEVLTFERNNRQGLFEATAADALIIENLALGYEVRFLLESFEVRESNQRTRIRYGGQPKFAELTAQNERQERRWRRNRENAYRGSQRHFLAALTSDRLYEEGYLLIREEENRTDYSGVPGSRASSRVRGVEPDDILSSAGLPFERTLDFEGYLKVINTKEIPEDQYLDFKDMVAGWKLTDDEQQQTSWLTLTRGPVTITTDGRLNEPFGITKLGYWYFERVAEMLPIEYTPGGSALFTPAPAMSSPPAFDVLSADALINRVIHVLEADTTEAAIEQVSEAYLTILEKADTSQREEAREVVHKHLAQMIFLLPDSIRDNVLSKPYKPREKFLPIEAQAGETLATWWRSQDPLPATVTNERVMEHLLRVRTASGQFADQRSSAGFDDRGHVFVRYGSPRMRGVIKTDLVESRKVLQQFAVPLPGPMIIPQNEFWSYRHLDDRLQFLFLLTGGRYRISSPEDLIPDELRSASKRSGNRQVASGNAPINRVDEAYARALVAAYSTVYRDLALYHPVYEEQVQQLDFYEADIRATSGLDLSDNQTDLASSAGGLSASSYVQGISSQFVSLALQARIERDDEAPRQNSSVMDRVVPLSVPMRPARFLDDAGVTQLELYWSHVPGTLALTEDMLEQLALSNTVATDRYLVNFSVVEQGSDYSLTSGTQLSYLASDLERGSSAPIQSIKVPLNKVLQRLSLQWNQYNFKQTEAGDIEALDELKVGVQHLTNLRPLSSEAGVLEMSDPKPVYLGNEDLTVYFEEGKENVPPAYPFTTITPETPLGIYFEVYELFYDADNQTHFTVEYEVTRQARRRRGQETTSATTSYTTSTRTAREFIAIDLTDSDGEGPLDIRLRITDAVSQQHVERTIRFVLSDAR